MFTNFRDEVFPFLRRAADRCGLRQPPCHRLRSGEGDYRGIGRDAVAEEDVVGFGLAIDRDN